MFGFASLENPLLTRLNLLRAAIRLGRALSQLTLTISLCLLLGAWITDYKPGPVLTRYSGFYFKGTSFGLYNTGNGRATLAKAKFAYWKQTPVIPAVPVVARDEM